MIEEKKTPSWLREIMSLLESSESFRPEPYWLKGEWPKWVEHVAGELSKAMFPVGKFKASGAIQPGLSSQADESGRYWPYEYDDLLDSSDELAAGRRIRKHSGTTSQTVRLCVSRLPSRR